MSEKKKTGVTVVTMNSEVFFERAESWVVGVDGTVEVFGSEDLIASFAPGWTYVSNGHSTML